ncbi:DUF998 domain-containing protein [Micromonospora sp. R77]|uniref:DUF998 domain-containing protein n=1 Tax=Micromonospora sp. R77 TaxID=2925836 RepID=UPI001F600584|nr:DUF998 domain-containing protein [Micromonospora sp. R77]MCI4064230.1 DUF998 domain-containing protein [Micromonospora sp. R77]
MPGTRMRGLLALGGIALAATLVVLGHLEVNEDLNPWSLTVSDFAVSDRGGVVDVAMVLVAAATALLIPAVRRYGGPAGLLLAVWAAGLVTAAVVPTNEPGLPMDTAAYVHRYASVVAFLALPSAGWLLAPRLPARGRPVRGLAVVGLLLAGAMAWSAYPGDRMLIGLVERLLLLTEVALLAVVAATLARPGDRAGHGAALDLKEGSAPRV